MGHEIIRSEGAVLVAKITGFMKLSDQEALQKAGVGLMARGLKVRLHLTLEDFRGWGDVDFLMAHGDEIERIAVVGDARWKDQILAFLGKGFRTTEIEFFPASSAQDAERWIHEYSSTQ